MLFRSAVVFPYPKQTVDVVLFSRNHDEIFEEKFRYTVNPENYFIKKDRRLMYPSFAVHVSGDPAKNIDIVILPDGYSNEEMGLFIDDCRLFADGLFDYAPYNDNKDKFNIIGILAPSDDSGNDIPADNVWKKTLLNTGFYTFDSPEDTAIGSVRIEKTGVFQRIFTLLEPACRFSPPSQNIRKLQFSILSTA